MPWSADFCRRLAAPMARPIVVVRTIPSVTALANAWRVSTSGADFYGAQIAREGGVSDAGDALTPRSWASTVGGWTVQVVGDLAGLFQRIARGQLCEMLVGFEDYAEADYQRVRLGMLWAARRTSAVAYRLEFRDLKTALISRLSTAVDEQQLFYAGAVEASTTVGGGGYTAGSGTLPVASTTDFIKQDNGGGGLNGLLKITPTTGDPFYLTWTGITGSDITVSTGGGSLGTSDVTAVSGDQVDALAYIDDHPIDAFRRIIVSTGTANANSAYDTLPESWGLGLPWTLIDGADCDKFLAASQPSSGTDDWELYSAAPVADGLSWLEGILSLGGYFITERQGLLTCRCIRNPHAGQVDAPIPVLSERHIIVVNYHDLWDPRLPIAYARSTVTGNVSDNNQTATLPGLPGQPTYTHDIAPYIWLNETLKTEVSPRVKWWVTRTPEILSLKCTIDAAQLSVGDRLEVAPSMVQTRTMSKILAPRPRAIVTRRTPNWLDWSCDIELALLPDYAGPWPSA